MVLHVPPSCGREFLTVAYESQIGPQLIVLLQVCYSSNDNYYFIEINASTCTPGRIVRTFVK